ncbi:NADPH:quinone reductase [Variovorax sp. NFACC27]|uniref:NADPH:quinone reductase n=1 Tax=unclassified Variovorax TaxID=663243 RepID=UPI000895B737|nr:NADPH2:quinone reductase [Variovorax sp. NFACC28]SEG97206.1 NADPH2:quinone reductase [Variovorax sp. NFACC29]SFD89182.1 NADPH2:quinone reductase [Variovorax sp. NFACC26]SFH17054.1 NADPH2:quinone reductase [Variovorax sp. NFACC27]
MRAAWYSKNGDARDVLVVGELPVPTPGPGEVRVKVVASGVNPSDVKARGARPLGAERVVPHSDGAGVIDAVGDGVSPGRLGERVWIWNGQWQRPMGTAAEFIVLPEVQAVRLHESMDFAVAACFGIPLMTAVHAVQRLGDIAGKSVLVIGASSAVGHYAAQLAVIGGARVIGTVGSESKAQHALAAGVDATIDYKTEPLAERVKQLTAGRGVDAIVDMDFSTTVQLLAGGGLAPHGALVSYGSNVYEDIAVPYRALLWNSFSLHFFLVYDLAPQDRRIAIDRISRMTAGKVLSHTIGAKFGIDEIAAAHEAVEAGKLIGNVVVELG